MGLLRTEWEAGFEGRSILVVRNEWTKGFALEWDGRVIARRSWSFLGLGGLAGEAEHEGRVVRVEVALEWAGLRRLGGRCRITVDGEEVPAAKVK